MDRESRQEARGNRIFPGTDPIFAFLRIRTRPVTQLAELFASWPRIETLKELLEERRGEILGVCIYLFIFSSFLFDQTLKLNNICCFLL